MMMLVQTEVSEEDELILSATNGDRGAFGELYVRYARMVHGILLARVPAGDAEDLVQDVFMSAMRQLRGLRTAAAERKHGIDGGADAFLVLDLIRKLPEAYQETLVFRLVEGMTGPEIAEKTGLTPESVRVNLCRGMKMLRELLGGKETK